MDTGVNVNKGDLTSFRTCPYCFYISQRSIDIIYPRRRGKGGCSPRALRGGVIDNGSIKGEYRAERNFDMRVGMGGERARLLKNIHDQNFPSS